MPELARFGLREASEFGVCRVGDGGRRVLAERLPARIDYTMQDRVLSYFKGQKGGCSPTFRVKALRATGAGDVLECRKHHRRLAGTSMNAVLFWRMRWQLFT